MCAGENQSIDKVHHQQTGADKSASCRARDRVSHTYSFHSLARKICLVHLGSFYNMDFPHSLFLFLLTLIYVQCYSYQDYDEYLTYDYGPPRPDPASKSKVDTLGAVLKRHVSDAAPGQEQASGYNFPGGQFSQRGHEELPRGTQVCPEAACRFYGGPEPHARCRGDVFLADTRSAAG